MPQRGEVYKCKRCGESGVLIQAGRAKISNAADKGVLYGCNKEPVQHDEQQYKGV